MTVTNCIGRLERFYGLLPTPPADPFRVFVWEALSTQSAPAKRDAAYAALRQARVLTPDAMGRASQATLERAAALAGPYVEQRLRTLRAGADLFRRSPGLTAAINGPLRAARRALAAFPQLGDAGAHRMLLFASNYPVLPIDARVHRVAVRLGYGSRDLHAGHSAHAIRRALSRELPRDVEAVRRAYLYLSHHGAATCTEADPHCIVCPLLAECPDGRTRLEI